MLASVSLKKIEKVNFYFKLIEIDFNILAFLFQLKKEVFSNKILNSHFNFSPTPHLACLLLLILI